MHINSFNQIYIHFVIVVKDRAKLITPTLEPILHKYISSIIENRKNKTLIINGSKDHVHILISMHTSTIKNYGLLNVALANLHILIVHHIYTKTTFIRPKH